MALASGMPYEEFAQLPAPITFLEQEPNHGKEAMEQEVHMFCVVYRNLRDLRMSDHEIVADVGQKTCIRFE